MAWPMLSRSRTCMELNSVAGKDCESKRFETVRTQGCTLYSICKRAVHARVMRTPTISFQQSPAKGAVHNALNTAESTDRGSALIL